MPRKSSRNLLGAIPAVVFCGLAAALFSTLCKADPFSVGDAIATTIIVVVAFNSFFVISLVLFYVWWFKRSKVALILSVTAFALNALGWLVGFVFCAGEFERQGLMFGSKPVDFEEQIAELDASAARRRGIRALRSRGRRTRLSTRSGTVI